MSQPNTGCPSIEKTLRKVGLEYTNDLKPGISRVRRGKNFEYLSPNGKRITQPSVLKRISSLVLPPAWKSVWICTSPKGHLQATGRDALGRKQYRYHPAFRLHRDETKFHRIVEFAEKLPRLRRRIQSDLTRKGLPREKVLATVVRLLETTLIRVGNEEYARSNKSYGLTTIKDKHVKTLHDGVRFSFVGKSGVAHNVEVSNERLCKIIRSCQDLPGQHLFQYIDETGRQHNVTSGDVNQYIREISGNDYSAKDFRTWRGTVLAATALERVGEEPVATKRKKKISNMVKDVAEELRNRPATCRKYYIHPTVLASYDSSTLIPLMKRMRPNVRKKSIRDLSIEEQTVLCCLKQLLLPKSRVKQRARPVL